MHRAHLFSPTLSMLLLPVVLAGCEAWPLYAHLPDPNVEEVEPDRISFVEDAALAEGAQQLLGSLTAPVVVTVTGSVDTCGFDPSDSSHDWPEHPVDTNGDGVADESRSVSGWYTGDVDIYTLWPTEGAWLDISLSWDNAPAGEVNSPWEPTDETGSWTEESDLDFVLFEVDELGALGPIVVDEGFSSSHPELLAQLWRLEVDDAVAVVVACHHALSSAYTLSIELRLP